MNKENREANGMTFKSLDTSTWVKPSICLPSLGVPVVVQVSNGNLVLAALLDNENNIKWFSCPMQINIGMDTVKCWAPIQ